MERWLDIPGYEGRYQVSDLGRVRSLDHYVRLVTRKGEETRRLSPGKVLAPGTLASGHRYVYLGKRHRHQVHRLVLLAFVGPCPDGHEALHRPDHDPSNNRLDNLCWGTRSQNLIDDYKRGSRFRSLSGEQVAEIKKRASRGLAYGDVYRLSIEYGCNPGTMHKLIHGEGYKSVR